MTSLWGKSCRYCNPGGRLLLYEEVTQERAGYISIVVLICTARLWPRFEHRRLQGGSGDRDERWDSRVLVAATGLGLGS